MKKKSLKRKIALNMVFFAIVLLLIMNALVAGRYYNNRIRGFTEDAYEFTRTAAELIDGDKVPGYIETWERDHHYDEINTYINAVQKETLVKYFYVVIPLRDEMVYIWDAGPGGDAYSLGFREKYQSEEDRKAMMAAMSKDPPEKLTMESDDIYGFVASAYTPIYDSSGEPVALACVDLPMPDFLKAIVTYFTAILLSMIAATFIATAMLFVTINRDVIGPINILKKNADEMVDNLENDDEPEKIDIHTGDEIEELADAFTKMNGDLREYIRDLSEITSEKERISAELNIAAAIQNGMLPVTFTASPEMKRFDMYATMDPAKEVGGDFYDFFMVDDRHIALVMADVSSKGIPASLFMMISKIFIKNNVQDGMSPSEALAKTNEQLLENNRTGMFVTVWLAVIDLATGRGIAANAGHEHPALRKRNGLFELIKYKHSPAVGMLEGIVYREHEFRLDPGDTLFVYTDGVTEATDADEKLFGEDRMLAALNIQPDAEPEQILMNVEKGIDEFVGDAPQFDDITMLAFRYNGDAMSLNDVRDYM